jgi:iron-sulfur cluster repair protein YtfE (RIC family)
MRILMRNFEEEYHRLRSRVAEVRRVVHRIREGRTADASRTAEVLRLFTQDILPHAHWTERVVYPLVESDPSRPQVSTVISALRRQNARLARLVRQLDELQAYRRSGVRAFAVLALELAGITDQHLEDERLALAPTMERLESLLLQIDRADGVDVRGRN